MIISPYGGKLVNLVVHDDERVELAKYATTLPFIQLSPRSLCDLFLLATGGFSPLDRFMSKADYTSVLEDMRLASGVLFPIPITLPITDADRIARSWQVALRSPRDELIAIMEVEEVFEWSLLKEASVVCGTVDSRHPLVAEMTFWGRRYVSGPLRCINVPTPCDFMELRKTPGEIRHALEVMGYANVVAFHTNEPLHRAHEEFTKRAVTRVDGSLLILPVVGPRGPGDLDDWTRVRSYQAVVERYYDRRRTLLSVLPLAMRMAGPREALLRALILRNYGANHFIVGKDHAWRGGDSRGRPFYESYDAQGLVRQYESEVGVKMVPLEDLVYVPDEDRFEEEDRLRPGTRRVWVSWTEARRKYLDSGERLPAWFARPEAAAILTRVSLPRHKWGFCVWFTGLSCSGKSTITEVLALFLVELGREVTLLDGDVVRTLLSKGLGFSKEDRDMNVRRMGFVAAEIVRHEGVVICAAISPYRATRDQCRAMVREDRFLEVFVDTPLEVCEQRDQKGMYARARRGELKGFTGIDDPYEAPLNPEIRVTTRDVLPEDNARRIVKELTDRGFLLEATEE